MYDVLMLTAVVAFFSLNTMVIMILYWWKLRYLFEEKNVNLVYFFGFSGTILVVMECFQMK